MPVEFAIWRLDGSAKKVERWEKGMFANQNTACALRSSFTRDRVMARLGLDQ